MRIEKLAPSTKVQGRWLCHLEDGGILRVGEGEVVSFSLHSGMELTEEQYEALRSALRRTGARERALALISSRPMSRKELLDKLTARPRDPKKEAADPEQAEEAVSWLEELGYLNDEEYARTVVRHYTAKGYGVGRLRDELRRRGVPRIYWETALEEAEGGEEAIDTFLRRKLKGKHPDEQELRRASAALARRGFRWEEIKSALRRYGADMEGE